MGDCGTWLEMTQKNKPQSNTLAAGIMTVLVTGMFVGSTIFNMDLRYQPWTFDHSDSVVLLTSISFYMAAVVGSLAGYFLVERRNKKTISRVYLVLTAVGSVLLIVLPDHLASVAFARILIGLAHGIAFLVTLIHAGETSVKELRGLNTVAMSYCLMIGIVTHGSLSPVANHSEEISPNRIIGIIGIVYVAFGGLLSQFLTYESPVFLIQRRQDVEAIKSMMKLRNESTETWEIRNDYTEFKTMLEEDDDTTSSIFEDGNLRPLAMLIACKIAAVLSFNTALNLVRLHILDTLFNLEDYSLSAVTILTIRIAFASILILVVDKFGRKAPMTASTFLCGIVLTVMGIVYLAADSINRDLAIAIMLTYEVVATGGITLIPDVYCSEAFSTKKKAASIAVVQTVENILQLAINCIVFTWNFEDAGIYGGILITCGIPLLVLAVAFNRYLPETTKMSIRQSRTEFTKRGEIVFRGTKRPPDFLND